VRSDSDLSAVRWDARGVNNGLIFSATYHGVTRLPRACSYALGHVGTRIAYHLLRDGTDALIDNLKVVRPEATERQLKALALLTYRTYAKDTIDFIRSLEMDPSRLGTFVSERNAELLDQLLQQRKGVILVGGHFGNWELGGVALRLLNGYRTTIIAKAEASAVVGAIRRRMRESLGIDTLEIGRMLETSLQIRRLLAANGIVAMLLDRHIGRDRVAVRFFGRSVAFLRSPAMIGYMSGAPLLPAFMVRQHDGRFSGFFGDPIVVDASQPTEISVQLATQKFAGQLEAEIRANPHLWYQFYPYWRTESAASE
jgi:KDO2-lipid IV(A) lauroyltransferase